MIITKANSRYIKPINGEIFPTIEYTIDYNVNSTKCRLIFKSKTFGLTKLIKLYDQEYKLLKLATQENLYG